MGKSKETDNSAAFPASRGTLYKVLTRFMSSIRENPPKEVAGLKVLGIRDFKTGIRTAGGKEEALDYPKSNVLYYEIEGGNWLCIRPSGTEPKIKLYVASRANTQAGADELNDKMTAEAQEWMK